MNLSTTPTPNEDQPALDSPLVNPISLRKEGTMIIHHLSWFFATRMLYGHGALAGVGLAWCWQRSDPVMAFLLVLLWFFAFAIWLEWRNA